MRRRAWAALLAATVAGSVLFAIPSRAQEPPREIPENPNIVDPAGDANEHSALTGASGGASIAAADFLNVWFTHDPDFVYVHLNTSGESFQDSIHFEITTDPGVGDTCMTFYGWTPGAFAPSEAYGGLELTGDCGDAFETEGIEFTTEPGPPVDDDDETFIHTIKVPRTLSEHLADGKTLGIPMARSRHNVADSVGLWTIDVTEEGTEYVIAPAKKAKKKKAPAPKPKPAKKKKKKKAKTCKPYTSSVEGAEEAELTRITAAATEEKPIEVPLEAPAGLPEQDPPPKVFQNAQIVSNPGTNGLYVRVEFPSRRDLDLYLLDAAGEEVASAAGFNTAPVGDLNDTDSGGHSEEAAEQIDGFAVTQCAGYTVDITSYMFEGGEVLLKFWLGAPPEEEGQQAYREVLALF